MKNSSLKILIVDDDLDIIEILKYNLKKSGYSTKSANNGIEAIKTVSYTHLTLPTILLV